MFHPTCPRHLIEVLRSRFSDKWGFRGHRNIVTLLAFALCLRLDSQHLYGTSLIYTQTVQVLAVGFSDEQ